MQIEASAEAQCARGRERKKLFEIIRKYKQEPNIVFWPILIQ